MPRLSIENRLNMVQELKESRLTVKDLCAKYNITPRTLYLWKERYQDNITLRQPRDRVKDAKRRPKLKKEDAVAILKLALNRPVLGPQRLLKTLFSNENGNQPKETISQTTIFSFLHTCELNIYRLRLQLHHKWRASDTQGRDQILEELLDKSNDFYTNPSPKKAISKEGNVMK